MILVDHQIRAAVKNGILGIDNFEDDLIQPASYDLRIGPHVYSGSEQNPDHPVDLSKNGGNYRIPPYGNVVLITYEVLSLPPNMVGRFGLKSGFTRKGLFASAGPQVDPGFHGKLIVTILNLTPASHIISYKESFLSIEFNKLNEEASVPYHGPYQGLLDVGRGTLEDLVRWEGLNLNEMQSQFTELTQHVREWSKLATRFDDFLKGMERHTDAIDNIVKLLSKEEIEQDEPDQLETRKLTLNQASTEILALFKKEKRLYYSDIAEQLELDIATVINACDRLKKRGLIEGDPNGEEGTKGPND